MRFRTRVAGLLALALLAAPGCGSAVKKDVKRLKNKCNVVHGNPVSAEQARCIAGVFGIQEKKSCPAEVDRPTGFPEPVYRVRESCNGLGVVVAESSGRVLAIMRYDEILY